MRTIQINVLDGGAFSIEEGNRTTGELTFDEMLGQVACMTITPERAMNRSLFGMFTHEEYYSRWYRSERYAPIALLTGGTK